MYKHKKVEDLITVQSTKFHNERLKAVNHVKPRESYTKKILNRGDDRWSQDTSRLVILGLLLSYISYFTFVKSPNKKMKCECFLDFWIVTSNQALKQFI